ncbi:MAG TPA: toll/interleukin-1 receptor domain-containing protein [Thermodesulfovibrionia bacterium]|nr:toll/interleukin-1 receptor domain-containing protein [Thermodesulfovibrionia bacterium]
MSKVFLSYSRKDESFVKKLYQRLYRDGVELFFDQVSIEWGQNWVLELEKGLDMCEHVVFVLTPDFCNASEWDKVERTNVMADDPAQIKRKFRPLLLKPCIDLETFPRFLKAINYIDVTTDEKFEAEYPKICKALGGTIRQEMPARTHNKMPQACPLPDKHRLPYFSIGQRFVGRESEIWAIHDTLSRAKTAVIDSVGVVMGVGGIGKSQLAIEYAHRFGCDYLGGVFWVDSERGRFALIEQVAEPAGLKIDGKLKEQEQVTELWTKLSHDSRAILIILDSFPENTPLRSWLPAAGNIHTLVTTRRRDLTYYTALSLNFLSVAQGIELLNKGNRQFGNEAKPLVTALGGLPLALELVRNFLNRRQNMTVRMFLNEMKRIGDIKALDYAAKNYSDELPNGHVKEITATFEISWTQASPASQEILQILSLLAPVSVPRRLIRKIMQTQSENLIDDPIEESISELHSLSLIELDETSDPKVHRLMLAFAKTKIPDNSMLYQKTAKGIAEEMARCEDVKDFSAYKELEQIAIHADIVLSQHFADTEDSIKITNYLSLHHWRMGRYRLAEEYGRKAVSMAESHYEKGHATIAEMKNSLAMVLWDLGELAEAKELLRESLASVKKTFEPGHPEIATSQNNLAMVLRDLGELAEAKELIHEALESDKKTFEPGHPYIAIDQFKLALMLWNLGEQRQRNCYVRLTIVF